MALGRKVPLGLAACIALVGWIASGALWSAPIPGQQPRPFVVENGQNLKQIAQSLADAGIIRNAAAFRILARLKTDKPVVKAGYYNLSGGMDASKVLSILLNQAGSAGRFTVPEGFCLQQIADLAEHQGLVSAAELQEAARNPDPFKARFPWLAILPPNASLEGFLFPDTYFVGGGRISASSLISLMLERFGAVAWPQLCSRTRPLGPFAIVTLGSIVEREARRSQERPLIAGVFLARLRLGMPLGSDPTIEYVLGRRQDADHRLSLADVRIDSPYNTYRRRGLPPGPIANPGLASLDAVLNPKRSPYLYFVARGDGTHEFSATYAKQLVAQRHYRPGHAAHSR